MCLGFSILTIFWRHSWKNEARKCKKASQWKKLTQRLDFVSVMVWWWSRQTNKASEFIKSSEIITRILCSFRVTTVNPKPKKIKQLLILQKHLQKIKNNTQNYHSQAIINQRLLTDWQSNLPIWKKELLASTKRSRCVPMISNDFGFHIKKISLDFLFFWQLTSSHSDFRRYFFSVDDFFWIDLMTEKLVHQCGDENLIWRLM